METQTEVMRACTQNGQYHTIMESRVRLTQNTPLERLEVLVKNSNDLNPSKGEITHQLERRMKHSYKVVKTPLPG